MFLRLISAFAVDVDAPRQVVNGSRQGELPKPANKTAKGVANAAAKPESKAAPAEIAKVEQKDGAKKPSQTVPPAKKTAAPQHDFPLCFMCGKRHDLGQCASDGFLAGDEKA
jgi:hypothetical protein